MEQVVELAFVGLEVDDWTRSFAESLANVPGFVRFEELAGMPGTLGGGSSKMGRIFTHGASLASILSLGISLYTLPADKPDLPPVPLHCTVTVETGINRSTAVFPVGEVPKESLQPFLEESLQPFLEEHTFKFGEPERIDISPTTQAKK